MQILQNTSIANSINAVELNAGYSGYASLDPEWKAERTSSIFNMLYIVEQGTAVLQDEHNRYIMQPGMAYLVPPSTVISYHCPLQMTMLFFHFNLYRPDHYDLLQGVKQVLEVSFPTDRLAQLKQCYEGVRYADGILVRRYLYEILADIQQKYNLALEEFPEYSAHVQNTIDYIQENLSAKLRLQDLSRRISVSRTYLSDQFRREVGISPGHYIDDQLMLRAQWMLDQTSASIEEISQTLGFCDQFYFSRRFKQVCGTSPSRYRKTVRPI